MGLEQMDQSVASKGFLDSSAPVPCKNAKHSYSREFLLSFAELERCKKQPSGLDHQVLRDPPPGQVVEGAIAASSISARGLIRRDRDGDGSGEVLQNIPEWRRTPGNAGVSMLSQGSRRGEQGGSTFSNNFTSRSGLSWGENSHPRSNHERSAWQVPGSGGGQGRWEHRLGGGDRDRDRSRHDRDMSEHDSGRRSYGGDNLSRQGVMPLEHDGLLGSGGSLPSSGSSGGTMLSNIRGNDRHHTTGRVNPTSDSHLPLRASRMPTHSRRENTDSINDETFGTDEVSNQERIEQERKRRDSFELMRKEQQKVLQEKNKLNKQVEERLPDSTVASDKKHDVKSLWEDGRSLEDNAPILPLPDQPRASAASKATLPVVTVPTAPRPLVPPGFTKVFLEKRASMKSANIEVALEVGDTEISKVVNTEFTKEHPESTAVDTPLDGNKVNQVKEGQSITSAENASQQDLEGTSEEGCLAATGAGDLEMQQLESEIPDSHTVESLDTVSNTLKSNKTVSLPEIGQDGWTSGFDDFLDGMKSGDTRSNVSEERPESILDRLFCKASTDFDRGDGPIPAIESQVIDGNDNCASKKSKFARWFHTEEEKPKDDMLVREASDILSLLSKSERGTHPISSISEERVILEDTPNSSLNSIFPRWSPGRVLPMPAGPSLEDVEKVMTATANENIHDEMDQFQMPGKPRLDSSLRLKTNILPENPPKSKDYQSSTSAGLPRVVLTCEDLEQSIIAEASESVPKLQHHSEEIHTVSVEDFLTNKQSGFMDNHASQHLLSLLQKGSNTNDQRSSIIQDCNEYIGSLQGRDYGENSYFLPNADKIETSEKTGGAQTLEFLFGKAFMKELRSVEAPVSVKTLPNDTTGKPDGVESSFAAPLNRVNTLGNADFETAVGNRDSFPSSRKTSMKEGRFTSLQSREPSLDGTVYTSDQDLWRASSSHGIQSSIGNSHFENTNGSNGDVPLFGTGPKSGSSISDFGSEVLEGGSAFQMEGNPIMRGLFDSGSKGKIYDEGLMLSGQSFPGQDLNSNGVKLTSEESSTIVGRLSSSGNSPPLSVNDVIPLTNLPRSHASDDFLFSDVAITTPELVQKLGIFTNGKSRYEENNLKGGDGISQHYRGVEGPISESRIPLNDLMRTSYASSPLASSSPQSGGVDPAILLNSTGMQQIFGLSPTQPFHLSQQQMHAPTEFPGPRVRPLPPFFPYHHRPGPYDLNLGGSNALQQLNHQQTLNNQQMKMFNHGSSLESQHPVSDPWSDHFSGRPLSQEPSGQMVHPLHNVPSMIQPVHHSLRPHGFPPSHFMQPVQVPQGGHSFPSNNFPFIPDQLPHGPRGLPSNYAQHVPGGFMPDIPLHSMPGAPFHLQPNHNALGRGGTHNQSVKPVFGSSSEFNAPGGAHFDGSRHVGAVGNNGAILDMLFAKDSRRQSTGPVSVNNHPYGLEPGRNIGYG